MQKPVLRLRAVIAAAVIFVILTASACVVLPRRAFPKVRGSVTVPGIAAPIEIVRDKFGVPHIYAQNAEDLYFAHGYVHAQDRFWQMEFQRRVGAGRLSELFGEATVETDIFLRTLGFEQVVREEYELLDQAARSYLDAYVAGVNAYIRDRKPGKISMEYSLLKLTGTDFTVEEWTARDTLTWAKMMSWSLASNLETERFLLSLLRTAGVPGAEYYYMPYREDMPFVITNEELREHAPPPLDERAGKKPGDSGEIAERAAAIADRWLNSATGGRNEGTNSWVVTGERSETGSPLLVNDTHLGVQMPSIWYEVGLHIVDETRTPLPSDAGGMQMRGFSFPGFPGVIIGHNDAVAWGIADFGDDVQDLYVERINPHNPNQYEVNGTWRDMELRHERIDVQGEVEPIVHIVRSTRHGPIISDRGSYKVMEAFGYAADATFPDNLELTATALQWTALVPGEIWNCFYRLQRASSVAAFREGLSYFNGPVLSFIYADTEGNIGYQTAGHIPIRPVGRGRVPRPGWNNDFEWRGYVPFEELPAVLNPAKGYVVAANNPAVAFDYPYDLGTTWVNGYRARRIAELIEQERDGVSIEDAIRIQNDTFDRTAAETIPHLEGLELSAPEVSPLLQRQEPTDRKERRKRKESEAAVDRIADEAREMLLGWDHRMETESAAAAVYALFFHALAEGTFKDQFPYDRWASTSNRRLEGALYLLMDEPENALWDDVRTPDVRETRDTILVRSFREGLQSGVERMGDNVEKWSWGELHTIEFREPTLGSSGKGFIERIFNLGPVAVPGSVLTVNHSGWKNEEPFITDHFTSNRQIIDLGNLSASLMIHAPGQSGHARHRHYDDFLDSWRHAEYHPTLWEREEAERGRSPTLVLEPER